MSLTKTEKVAMFNSLSEAHKKKIAKVMGSNTEMSGEGFMDILKKLGSGLAEIVKAIGPIVLKEVIVPYVKTKMSGSGPRLPGGGVLHLPGQGTSLAGGAKRKRGRPKKIVGGAYGDLQV